MIAELKMYVGTQNDDLNQKVKIFIIWEREYVDAIDECLKSESYLYHCYSIKLWHSVIGYANSVITICVYFLINFMFSSIFLMGVCLDKC